MEVMLENLEANEVTISYGSDRFSRIQPKNLEKIRIDITTKFGVDLLKH